MLFKTALPALVALVCVSHASAQVTTTLPFEISDGFGSSDGSDDTNSDVIMGEIVGTGADGTTYVLSAAATGSDDTPLTITLVENASAASAVVSLSEDGAIEMESIACGFGGDGSAVCTEAFIVASDTFTTTLLMTTSGVADTLTAVVSTATGTSGAGSGSGSGSSLSSKSGVSRASSATGSASGAGASQSPSSAGRTTASVIASVLSLALAAVMA